MPGTKGSILKGPDLTTEAASLRKSVWRELGGLKKSVTSERNIAFTKSKGRIKIGKVGSLTIGKAKRTDK